MNVSGGRVGEEVAAWLDLARKLGLVAGKLLDGAAVALEVEARGELSTEQVDALGLSALRGLFSGAVDQPVTFVNAPAIAEQRGVELKVATAPESATHRSVLEVKAIASDGTTSSVVGALTALNQVEKIVQLNGRGIDLRAEGQNVFFTYADIPGALGKVGSKIGAAGINIDAAALTQAADGKDAVLIVRVEKEVPQDVLESIEAELDEKAVQFNFA